VSEPIKYAKLFSNGQSQAVRLPKEFRFTGTRVRVRRLGTGVLLEPASCDTAKLFEAIDACGVTDFMREGRQQPAMPAEEPIFE
jgi:antitoxin VapB